MIDFVDSSRRAATNDLNKLATDARKTAADLNPHKDREIISETKITRVVPKTDEAYLGATKSSLSPEKSQKKSLSKVNRAEADEWTKKLNSQTGLWKGPGFKTGGSVSLNDSQFMRDLRKK